MSNNSDTSTRRGSYFLNESSKRLPKGQVTK